MLKVDHISSGYGKKQVLYDVSFEVNQGEVVLLTGGNGSGKSTILKCIYNLLPLWSGAIYFDGERIDKLKPFEMIRRGIVYIPQKDFYFENLTVDENLYIAGSILPKKIIKQRIAEIYCEIGIKDLKQSRPSNLSGGEKKLLGFCMAMILKPRLLLYDEPFIGIDPSLYNKLYKTFYLSDVNIHRAILIVEHRPIQKELINHEINISLGKINKR